MARPAMKGDSKSLNEMVRLGELQDPVFMLANMYSDSMRRAQESEDPVKRQQHLQDAARAEAEINEYGYRIEKA